MIVCLLIFKCFHDIMFVIKILSFLFSVLQPDSVLTSKLSLNLLLFNLTVYSLHRLKGRGESPFVV